MTLSRRAHILLGFAHKTSQQGNTMNAPQRIAKTPKAWEALSRPDLVGRPAHSLLLMANGRRSERELSALLGSDISELARGLLQQGYLQPVPLMLYGDSDSA
jgi:hypothetical protein